MNTNWIIITFSSVDAAHVWCSRHTDTCFIQLQISLRTGSQCFVDFNWNPNELPSASECLTNISAQSTRFVV